MEICFLHELRGGIYGCLQIVVIFHTLTSNFPYILSLRKQRIALAIRKNSFLAENQADGSAVPICLA